MTKKIGIIGCGIIGISSGLLILENFPDARVTIFAEKVPPNTTGDVAAGLWRPFGTSEDPRIIPWGKATHDYYYTLLRHPDCDKIGLTIRHGYILDGPEENGVMPFWGSIPEGMRHMSDLELAQFPAVKSGHTFNAPICDGKRLNAWLLDQFFAKGGKFEQKKVYKFSDLAAENFECIINCTGLGATELCGDDGVYPVRGQVRRVRAPWVTYFVFKHTAEGLIHIIPNAEAVVLGGTEQKGDWSTDVRDSDLRHIVESTSKLVPSLQHAEVICDQVGLRPGRSKPRLELETIEVDGKAQKVIHNYGHGGSGYTLFYGCALEVVSHLKTLFNSCLSP